MRHFAGRTRLRSRRLEWATGIAIATLVPGALHAQTVLPRGGSVVSGQVQIGTPSGSAMTVTQSSSRAIIDWNSFSVGPNGAVNFIQPNSSSAILNRVTGSTTSTIAGQINANGEVFLVNPNGIAITPTGLVRVGGGFVGSTLDIDNSSFNAGRLNFSGAGPPGSVSNAGTIISGSGGFVGLIGGSVSNSGTISVPLGKVGLGSAQQATVDPAGDGFLQVAVPAGTVAADGRPLIDVAGRIRAAGGTIEIKAATVQQAVRDVVNVSGVLSARAASGRDGSIVLDSGAGGTTVVSGKLLAVGTKHTRGGSVTVTGNTVELRGALLDVSGGAGGGSIRVGTDAAGLNNATTVSVDQSSLLKADATVNGNGGNIKVWAESNTGFDGSISARGGSQGGNGGQAEVSGKLQLTLGDYGTRPLADLSAPQGTKGTLLFDPGTVNIVNQASLRGNSALNGPDTFTAQFISAQLATANVTIDTRNATGANGVTGDINLLSNTSIAWSGNSVLTLNAAHNINFASGASIAGTGAGAALILRSDSGGTGSGTINFSGGTQVSLPLGNVSLYFNPASNRTPANGGTNPAAGTVNSTSYTGTPAAENWSSFVSAGALSPWVLVNSISDLQNVNNNLGANYALGRSIDASATSAWNLGAGFVPLGTNGAGLVLGAGFTGNFDGMGNVISNLSINRTLASNVGLFGDLSGSVKNLGLANVSVAGASDVGGLAGVNSGNIDGSYVSGAVSSLISGVGGLVGWNKAGGSIGNSYATDAAHALVSTAGGLVGLNDGNIATSYATGATGTLLFSGGLVGSNSGGISQSYFDNQTTGQFSGVGLGSSSGVTGLSTSVLQNGTLPAGFSPAVWSAAAGQYPQLVWQLPASLPPSTSTVVITATDLSGGSPVYGNAPAFAYKVTDSLGNVLCTAACSTFFTGTPLIDSTLSSTSAAGASATAFIAQGTMVAASGFQLRFVNETLAVAPRPLIITASDQSKTYGAVGALGTSAFTTNGLVNGDIVAAVTLASAGSNPNASVAGGPYAIAASLAVGAGLSNYTISYANGLLTVRPAPVTVTALGGTSTIGSSPANPGLQAVGLQNGQGVSALTGLGNSFGITSTTTAGIYALGVTGSLTNSNYVLAGTNTGTWIVTGLRGSLSGGSSPSSPPSSTPSLFGNPPPVAGNANTAATLGDTSGAVTVKTGGSTNSAGSPAGGSRWSGGGAEPPAPSAPANDSNRQDAPPAPNLDQQAAPVRVELPNAAATSHPAESQACPPKAGEANGSRPSAGAEPEPCEQRTAKKEQGLIDFALSRLNRKALFDALDRGVSDVKNSQLATPATLVKLAAGGSLVMAVGFVSWLFRGGLLLGAFLSTMPLWQGFDPLAVVLNRRRNDRNSERLPNVDLMFDGTHGSRSLRNRHQQGLA